MKRILGEIAILLVLVCVLGISLLPANAEANEEETVVSYNGSFYYDQLGEKANGVALQQLYDRLDALAAEFHGDENRNAQLVTNEGDELYVAFELSYDDLSISSDEMVQVWMSYKNDHPLYYWMDVRLQYTESSMTILTTEAYADGEDRVAINRRLDDEIQEYLALVEDEESAYQIALAFHDTIIQAVDYARDPVTGAPEDDLWAHNVVGVLDGTGAVCEGYARMFQLMLNAAGVDNIFVVGSAESGGSLEAHAWNLVKLEDDQWYWCDLTWDDSPGSYFGVRHSRFCVTDTQDTNWYDGDVISSYVSFVDNHFAGVPAGEEPICDVTYPGRSANVFSAGDNPLLRKPFTVGELTYAVNGYGTVQLIDIGNQVDADFYIPETVSYNQKTYTVNAVGYMNSKGCFGTGTEIPRTVTTVHIPKTLLFIWDRALEGWNVEQYIVASDNPNFTAKDGVLYTKSLYTLIVYPGGAPYVETFVIPEETHEIAYGAFYLLEGNFSEIVLGKNVECIGIMNWGSGYHDSDVTGMFGGSITVGEINYLVSSFARMDFRLRISVAEGNTSYAVRDGFFCYAEGGLICVADTHVTEIIIPDGTTRIEDSLFEGCKYLTSVTIPNSVKVIDEDAFSGCISLKSIDIPDSVTSIGRWAFSFCTALEHIEIPAGVTRIQDYTFYRCTGLTSIEIPTGVISIGNSAFSDCMSLQSITLPDTVTSIGEEAFYWCRKMTDITLGTGVTSIGRQAFYSCGSLTNITVPDSVTSIGAYAFYSCKNLVNIVLGDGLRNIGNYAFYDCSQLNHVLYTGTEETWNAIVVGTNNSKLTNATRHDNCTGDEITATLLAAPSCAETGSLVCTCAICDESQEYTLSALGHYSSIMDVPPTCTESGYSIFTCVCGDTSIIYYGAPTGHSFENGVCTVCGAVLGDLDLDGDVDAADLTLLARHVAKIELLSNVALLNADVNGDWDVDAEDLTLHARFVAKIITSWDE